MALKSLSISLTSFSLYSISNYFTIQPLEKSLFKRFDESKRYLHFIARKNTLKHFTKRNRFGGPAALKISVTAQWGQSRHRPPEDLVNQFVNKNL